METPLLHGLAPRIAPDCRVLVLGSMPGGASLTAGRYYAHPRNRFWMVAATLCGFDPALGDEERVAALQRAGGGLWDVIGRCTRRGSLDSAIRDAVPNPLACQLRGLRQLRAIALNGGKAGAAFSRLLRTDGGLARHVSTLAVHVLPSTSPANAACSMERLLAEWTVLAPHLRRAGAGVAPSAGSVGGRERADRG